MQQQTLPTHRTSCRCSGGRGETRCQVQPPRGAGAGPVDAGSPTPGSREGRDLSWGGMGGRAAVEGEGAGSAAHGMPRTAASCPCTARPSWGTHFTANLAFLTSFHVPSCRAAVSATTDTEHLRQSGSCQVSTKFTKWLWHILRTARIDRKSMKMQVYREKKLQRIGVHGL